jgi:hypothetical protein
VLNEKRETGLSLTSVPSFRSGIFDKFAAKSVMAGRLTGKQLFESDATGSLIHSDAVGDEAGVAFGESRPPIIYAVDSELYSADALPDSEGSDDEDEMYAPESDEDVEID